MFFLEALWFTVFIKSMTSNSTDLETHLFCDLVKEIWSSYAAKVWFLFLMSSVVGVKNNLLFRICLLWILLHTFATNRQDLVVDNTCRICTLPNMLLFAFTVSRAVREKWPFFQVAPQPMFSCLVKKIPSCWPLLFNWHPVWRSYLLKWWWTSETCPFFAGGCLGMSRADRPSVS